MMIEKHKWYLLKRINKPSEKYLIRYTADGKCYDTSTFLTEQSQIGICLYLDEEFSPCIIHLKAGLNRVIDNCEAELFNNDELAFEMLTKAYDNEMYDVHHIKGYYFSLRGENSTIEPKEYGINYQENQFDSLVKQGMKKVTDFTEYNIFKENYLKSFL